MIAPASGQLAERFNIHSTVLLAVITSVFVLAYGGYLAFSRAARALCLFHCLRYYHRLWALITGPSQRVIWTLACASNRECVVPWYMLLIVIVAANGPSSFTVWNLACGFARSKNELIAFRFLAGLGGSAPLAIGGGVIGDLFDADHRGQAISIYSLAPLLGPVVGPVAGAWIAEKSTWRWVVRLQPARVTRTTVLTVMKTVLVNVHCGRRYSRIWHALPERK